VGSFALVLYVSFLNGESMEIILGIVFVFVLLIVIGKLKGAPDPANMSDAALVSRLQSEGAWIRKYSRLSYEDQQRPSLKKQYEEKTGYTDKIYAEITKRQTVHQVVEGVAAIEQELSPILNRAQELIKEGKPEAEALATSLKDWRDNAQAPTNVPAPEHLEPKVPRKMVIRTPTKEAQGEALRKGMAIHKARAEAATHNFDVEPYLEHILASLKAGYPLRSGVALYPWSEEQKDAIEADIEKEKARGVLDPDAIRAALTRFSTR
jgi:hypothetical protein